MSEIIPSLGGEKGRQESCRMVFAIRFFSSSFFKYSHTEADPVLPSLFEKCFEVETYFVHAKYYY